MSRKYYAYMLRCADDTIYSGYTVNLEKRCEVHNSGRGAKYTRARLPVRIVYFEEFDTKNEAMHREWEFKHMSKNKKEALILEQNEKECYNSLL